MARDYVTIANLATGFFGEDLISAPDEDSKAAGTIAGAWDEVRKFVLSQGEWNFAMTRRHLSARTKPANNPVIGYDNAFPLPADNRRFVEILEPAHCRDCFANEAGADGKAEILADTTGPLTIRYVRDVVDPALWSDGFTEAFAMRLAWQIADRLSGDKQRKKAALDAYELTMRRAKGTDARQNPPRRHVEGEWTRARRSGREDLSTGRH